MPRRRFDVVGTDVLGNAAGFASRHLGATDVVEQRGLAVVDVTHDGDHRRARLQRHVLVLGTFVIEEGIRIVQLGGKRLVAHFLDHDHRRFLVQQLVDGDHRAHLHQDLDDFGGLDRHLVGQIGHGNGFRHMHFADHRLRSAPGSCPDHHRPAAARVSCARHARSSTNCRYRQRVLIPGFFSAVVRHGLAASLSWLPCPAHPAVLCRVPFSPAASCGFAPGLRPAAPACSATLRRGSRSLGLATHANQFGFALPASPCTSRPDAASNSADDDPGPHGTSRSLPCR